MASCSDIEKLDQSWIKYIQELTEEATDLDELEQVLDRERLEYLKMRDKCLKRRRR